MTMAQPDSAQLPLWKKILFSVVGLLLLLGILELSAAWYLKQSRGYDGAHLLQYEFDPYKVILPTRNFVDTRGVTHNSQGFRHPVEVKRTKDPNTYRIFVMGGSTAYGTGGLWPHIQRDYAVLPDSVTIPAYLQQLLSREMGGRDVEVINAAIPSVWTHQHLIYLNQTILRYSPDLVVLMDGFNDYFFFDEYHDQFASYAYQAHSMVIMGDPTLKALVYGNVWWLSRRSAFAHLLYRQLQAVRPLFSRPGERVPIDPSAALQTLQQVFPANALEMVERIALILAHEDVDAIFVLQPLLILERDREGAPEIERELFEFNVDSYLPKYEAYMHSAVPYVSEQVRETLEPLGAAFIDATRLYQGVEGQIYTDYAHLTPLGNRIVAEQLARQIRIMSQNPRGN
jgi:hypothetical protein